MHDHGGKYTNLIDMFVDYVEHMLLQITNILEWEPGTTDVVGARITWKWTATLYNYTYKIFHKKSVRFILCNPNVHLSKRKEYLTFTNL